MDNQESFGYKLWNGRQSLSILLIIAVAFTLFIPEVGVVTAFVIAFAMVVICRKSGSIADIGMRRPESWVRLIATTMLYGIVIQGSCTLLLDPLFEKITGTQVDITNLDNVRGSVPGYIVLLAVGWIIGGFIEEVTFRGFILTRVKRLFGDGAGVTFFALLVSAVPFGIAHMYQDWAGVLSTGTVGFLLAVVYVRHRYNLWYAVFTHGFINTVGITMIYLDIDVKLGQMLF